MGRRNVRSLESKMTNLETLGQHLALLRKRAGLTPKQAALKSGISEKGIRNLEGAKKSPNFSTIETLAATYGCTLAAVFEPWAFGTEAAPTDVYTRKTQDILADPALNPSFITLINVMHRSIKKN